MLCQKCTQAQATIHLTSVKACRQVESHYCEPCFRNVGLSAPFALKPPPEPPK
jgi:protein-arginine kinase activator protein McsA